MLDIIIPTYKNKPELIRTLRSINQSLLPLIKITIIDDCSNIYYNDVFEAFPFITIYYNEKNIGPGASRQLGIELTREPYLMFIDTGDYFISNEIQSLILENVLLNSDTVMFSWQYLIKNKISSDSSNRMHGRIYKRSFIQNYNISFCPESSYINEDIGFNRLCRMIIKDKKLPVIIYNTPILKYTTNNESITKKNKNEFFYNQQNKGLSLNIIHAIKIAEQNNLSKQTILEEINSIMSGLYYCFLCTKYERPEFLQNAWSGARLFYTECFVHYTENTQELILKEYNPYVKVIYQRAKRWKNFKSINLQRFLKDLKQYEEVPSWYGGD